MAQTEVRRTSSTTADQSIGDLVSVAVKDVSQLLRYEIDLAKAELKQDVRRLGIGGALMVVAAFVGCLVLVLLCIALAFGLVALGIWHWAAFLIVAGLCLLLAGIAVLIGMMLVRKMDGMSKTRRSLSDDMTLLHRNGSNGSRHDGQVTGAGVRGSSPGSNTAGVRGSSPGSNTAGVRGSSPGSNTAGIPGSSSGSTTGGAQTPIQAG